MKVGDLVRVFDPDEDKMDGVAYSTFGIVIAIKKKSENPESYRVFDIYGREGYASFDEPYWAVEMVSEAEI